MLGEDVFEALEDGVCVSDGEGRIRYMNPAAERLLDVEAAAARETTLCRLLCGHLAAGGAAECASTCALRRPDSGVRAVTFQGRYGPKEVVTWHDFSVQRGAVWKNLRVRCLKTGEDGGTHLTLITDATAEVEAEQEKEDWRNMIAHDLRAPLSGVYSAIRALREGGEPSGPTLEAAERSCRRMLDLITLYLDVARLDAGAAVVRSVPVPLADLARREAAALGPAAREKNLEIALEIPEDLVVAADPDLLARVVQNVLDNAVKFTPLGGLIRLSAVPEGDAAVLRVRDTGVGVSPRELPLLFDRYHQARARREGKTMGVGLGLTFCREALTRMGGSISVESRLSEGTEFALRLPLAGRSGA